MCEVCLCSVLQLCVVLPFSSIPTPDWERKLRGLSPLTSEKERGRPRTRWVARLLALKHVKWVQVSLWCLCSKSCNLQFIRSPTLILGWDAGVKWHCPSYCVNFGRGGCDKLYRVKSATDVWTPTVSCNNVSSVTVCLCFCWSSSCSMRTKRALCDPPRHQIHFALAFVKWRTAKTHKAFLLLDRAAVLLQFFTSNLATLLCWLASRA